MNTTSPSSHFFERRWDTFSLFAVSFLAVSVSMGAALVGLGKVLVLLAVLGRMWAEGWTGVISWLRKSPVVVWIILLTLGWMALSGFWTIADASMARAAFFRHSRWIWLIAVLYLLRHSAQAWVVICWLALGQTFVVLMSWMMWLGVPIPFATDRYPSELGILFTSTLEQPVMGALLATLLWYFRERWEIQWPKFGRKLAMALLVMTTANVFLVMTGRTGYLVMLVFGGLVGWSAFGRKTRWVLALAPIAVGMTLFYTSPRFHHRVMEVSQDIIRYQQQGDVLSSQGARLEMWRVAIAAGSDKPIIGHGVGSYPKLYERYQGRDPQGASNPHQQYLFWFAEFGVIGLLFLLLLFASLIKLAAQLPRDASGALTCTVVLAATISLANCPFYGVGLGEFLLLLFAVLLVLQNQKDSHPRQ